MWCAMPDARGEKIVRSVPRSRCNLSCAPSTLARNSSSLILSAAGDGVCDRLLEGGDLLLAEVMQLLRRGGVVAVTIDDHGRLAGRW